jgi:putative ABC transport system permease protein
MLLWQMAWRNVWRYRRRSLLTVLTIALGLAFNILMRGIGDGFHEQMVDNSVRAQIGHIEIHRTGYQHDPALLKTLPDVPLLDRIVPQTPHLRGYSFRVLGDGLASTAENSAGVRIVGIVPQAERSVTTIDRAVIAGRFLDEAMSRPILIGERLSQALSARLNDKVVLLVQAADGSMGAQLFRIAGIFRSGSPDLDRGVVYLLREDAQSLFSLAGGMTEAALLLDSSESVAEAQRFLTTQLAGRPVEILPWYVVEPFLRQFIDLDDAFFYIIVLILFIVISVGILNNVMMSVFERVREFGVMMALGVKPRQVVRLVVQEAAVLALLGVALGALLGSGSTIAFAYTGINLSRYAAGASALGITTTVVYPELTSQNLIYSNLSVVAVVLLVALYPAIKAAGLRPVEAIRHI